MARSSPTSARHTDALLREVVRLYVSAQRSAHACCRGASGKECEALALLGGTGPITVQDFATKMGLEKTWASRLAVRLEKRGVVKRVDHPDDGRSWLLELTPKGREQCGSLNDSLDEYAVELLNGLPVAERSRLDRSLAHLRDALSTCLTRRCGCRAGRQITAPTVRSTRCGVIQVKSSATSPGKTGRCSVRAKLLTIGPVENLG